jgi:hypothetical protein
LRITAKFIECCKIRAHSEKYLVVHGRSKSPIAKFYTSGAFDVVAWWTTWGTMFMAAIVTCSLEFGGDFPNRATCWHAPYSSSASTLSNKMRPRCYASFRVMAPGLLVSAISYFRRLLFECCHCWRLKATEWAATRLVCPKSPICFSSWKGMAQASVLKAS